ncbi:unnamed protein product [Rotaria sp. Silwood2]|nr:unnamed protein product [Rotaria sp. Silwood2]
MTNKYPIHPEGLNLWQNLYNQSLTIDGKESIIQTDGTKQLVLLPNDALPNDVELTFILSALDQFENKENKIPTPFHFLKQNMKKVNHENGTSHLMGRLTTPDGKMWLKFLPNTHQLSGSSIHSDDLPTKANLLTTEQKTTEIEKNKKSKAPIQTIKPPIVLSPKLESTKKLTTSIDSSKSEHNLLSSITTRSTKKKDLLSAVKSLITPSRTPAPVTLSTPHVTDLVLIRHTSTPKPGETACRITIGGNNEATPL